MAVALSLMSKVSVWINESRSLFIRMQYLHRCVRQSSTNGLSYARLHGDGARALLASVHALSDYLEEVNVELREANINVYVT